MLLSPVISYFYVEYDFVMVNDWQMTYGNHRLVVSCFTCPRQTALSHNKLAVNLADTLNQLINYLSLVLKPSEYCRNNLITKR